MPRGRTVIAVGLPGPAAGSRSLLVPRRGGCVDLVGSSACFVLPPGAPLVFDRQRRSQDGEVALYAVLAPSLRAVSDESRRRRFARTTAPTRSRASGGKTTRISVSPVW